MIYDFLAWYFRRRWMVRAIIKSTSHKSNMKFIDNLINTNMIIRGSIQHRDCLGMMKLDKNNSGRW